ncbi:MAG TPA: hypothetical protein DDW65_10420 [Firmicutes bacterium]|nr:hypothetical protein [Bacillota bacterium]
MRALIIIVFLPGFILHHFLPPLHRNKIAIYYLQQIDIMVKLNMEKLIVISLFAANLQIIAPAKKLMICRFIF